MSLEPFRLVRGLRCLEMLQLGSPADLYRRPATPFAAQFFGETNRIPGTLRDKKVILPWGEFDAPGLLDGKALKVLVRPESIQPA